MAKKTEIKFNKKIWIEKTEGENIFGDGKYKLLKTIDEKGSLNLAIKELNLSYRKTWNKLKKIEDCLGFKIIESIQGGPEGGSSKLTEKGKKIIRAFDEFHAEHDEFFKKISTKIQQKYFGEI
mgnify:CR=1 FL=1